jgi:hypothetical protein
MIAAATADALTRVEMRAQDVFHAFESGFEPEDARVAQRGTNSVAALDPLSVVAPDGAYFARSDSTGTTYSRDGRFVFDDGTLRGHDGAPILGYTENGTLGPLRADPVDVALGRHRNARLDRDGTLSYERSSLDPRSGERRFERVVIGRVALARFPAGTQPLRRDALHVLAPRGVKASLGRPGEAGFGGLTLFARDLGRLDPVAGLMRLQEAYLSLEALRAAGQVRAGLDREAMNLVK